MITLFATEEISITDIQNAMKHQGVDVLSVVLDVHLRDKSKFINCNKAFLICSERSVLTAGERIKQVRDLIGEQAVLTACVPQTSSEHKKILHSCGATHVISPQSFAVAHIVERVLAQIIFDSDIEPFKCEELYGATKAMRDVYKHIEILSALDETVLIVGETGTGKELVASALHTKSRRNSKFICVNFAEITPDLLSSELFGHEQGAFTNAVKSRNGLLVEAADGTVFLDEIGELDLASQAKLLRVVEEKKVRKVGANKWDQVSARIILATNRNLEEECYEKRFRYDLYQRLKGFVIELPPLRERKADIYLLASHFVKEYERQYDKNLHISNDLLDDLFQNDWEGNVRELRNSVRKSAAYADSNSYLSRIALREISALKKQSKPNMVEFDPSVEDLETAVKRMEKAYLKATLAKTNGNVSAASKLAGIGRATFYKKIGIEEKD
jgi:DNA-binding NtrC family response regulator